MKVSARTFQRMDRLGLTPQDRFVLLDCIRRACAMQHLEALEESGSPVPVRLLWSEGVCSCGLSQAGYRAARKRLVAAGLLDRCRDSDKVRTDGRAKMLRDWFVVKVG